MDRPDGRRVLKFDGAFGPEGCGGGFAAIFKKRGAAPPQVVSKGCEGKGS